MSVHFTQLSNMDLSDYLFHYFLRTLHAPCGAGAPTFPLSPPCTFTSSSFAIFFTFSFFLFTARRSYASAVLGVVILSVRQSVCHTRALWLIQRTYRRYFYTTWKGNPSSFVPPNSGWWATSSSTFNGRPKWPTPFKKSLTSTDFRLKRLNSKG